MVECKGLDVAYGPVQVLFGVDFEVTEGEIVALLGTNGAGKSTLLKAVAGLISPSAGKVSLDGHDITGADAEAVTRAGVSLMPGGKGIFPTITVDEHLRLAAWTFRKDTARIEAARAEVLELFPILAERHAQPAGYLSGGEQQMLALAQAFMTKPRLLLVDELSLGLAPTVVGHLLDVLRTVHAAGTTIVIVEQSVNVALTLAQRAVFMEKGEVRFTGPTADLLERPDLLRSVFIRPGPEGRRPRVDSAIAAAPDDAPVLLSCRGIVKRFGGIQAVDEVDLDLRQGEILGLIGQNGAGKTTLFDCISGFLPIDAGTVELRGRDVTEWAPHERARAGLGRSFQEALLFPSLTTWETIAIAFERHLSSKEMVAAALHLPASYESEIDLARPGGSAHRADGAGRLPGQAPRRAVQRQPPHRRAGLHPRPGPGRRPARRTVGRSGATGDRSARAAAAPGAGLHGLLDARHRARHAAHRRRVRRGHRPRARQR